MDVRVSLQGLSPRVQDAEEADLRAEARWIGCNFEQRSSTGIEQETEEKLLVLPDQRYQGMGHAENQMEIAHRQQFLSPRT
jgi:hypothetical protein